MKRTPSLRQFAIRRDPYTENFETVESGLPKISIIIPARNEEKYIEECLDGLLRQTYQNFEIIVVDDGSSDRTAQLLQRYGMKDARIKIVTIDVDARLDGKDLGVLSRLYPFNR
ncbi:MAG: glycosyltransferase family A protein [Nitrososphaeraceae archaeon]